MREPLRLLQFAKVAADVPRPRVASGKISAINSQNTGANPIAKKPT
jgi:hypothetical protein